MIEFATYLLYVNMIHTFAESIKELTTCRYMKFPSKSNHFQGYHMFLWTWKFCNELCRQKKLTSFRNMFKDHIVDVDTTTTKHKVLEQISANRLYSFWSLEVSTFNFAKEDWQRSGSTSPPSCGIHFLTIEDSFLRLKLIIYWYYFLSTCGIFLI